MGQGTLQWLVFMVSVTGFRVTRPLVSAPPGTSARVFPQDELSGNAVLNVGSSIPETHQSRKRRALIRSGSQFGRFQLKVWGPTGVCGRAAGHDGNLRKRKLLTLWLAGSREEEEGPRFQPPPQGHLSQLLPTASPSQQHQLEI